MTQTERLRAIAGAGVMPAFISAAFGAPENLQYILFLFGATYGGLWMQHE